jgi:aminocarboxymuconate-semialdehyde decarboxylase
VPLFIHPAPAGIDGPAGDPHLDRYDMALTTGFAASETIAVGSLIFGEVLERHPDIDICLSHGGGAAMFLLGRMAQASRVRPWAPASLSAEGAYEEMLGKLWFDTNFAGWDQADPHLPDGFMDVLTANAKRLLRA